LGGFGPCGEGGSKRKADHKEKESPFPLTEKKSRKKSDISKGNDKKGVSKLPEGKIPLSWETAAWERGAPRSKPGEKGMKTAWGKRKKEAVPCSQTLGKIRTHLCPECPPAGKNRGEI